MSNDLERRTTINESTANHSADEAAIRDLYRELMDGRKRGSGDAAALTEDTSSPGCLRCPSLRLAEERFVIVPRDEGPELHDRIMGTCRASGLSPAVADRNAPSQTTALGLVAAGVGASLMWECMRKLRRPGVVYRPLAREALRMQTALAWRLDDASPVLREFVALAREYASEVEEAEAGLPGDAALSA